MIGDDLHIAAVLGEANLRSHSEELDLDISWLPVPGASEDGVAAGLHS